MINLKNVTMTFLSVLLMLISSCSSKKVLVRNLDEVYISSGVEQYFLSELPAWINFNTESACLKDEAIRYFNIDALMKSFTYSYSDALQIQANYNHEYLLIKEKENKILPVKEEEKLFYQSTEKVSNKILFFEPPKFKRIHLIWLDEALSSPESLAKLEKFVQSNVNDEGYPIFVTNCLTKSQAEKRFSHLGTKFITSEMFSIYDTNGTKKPKFMINISAFFQAEQKIIFYMQNKSKIINQLEGNFKVQNY